MRIRALDKGDHGPAHPCVSALAGLLRRDGSLVDTAGNGQRALEQLHTHRDDYAMRLRQHTYVRQRVLLLTGATLASESMAFLE